MPGRFIRSLLDRFNDVGMCSQHEIHAVFQKNLRPFFLIGIGREAIFRAPVRTNDGKVGLGFGLLNIGDHFLLTEHIHGIGHVIRQGNAVGAVSIIQKGNFHAVFFENINLIVRIVMQTENPNVRIGVLPKIQTVHNAFFSFVERVIGGMADDVETGLHQIIPDFIRGVECGITTDSKLCPAQDHLLIYQGQIRTADEVLRVRKDGIVAVGAVFPPRTFFHGRVQENVPYHDQSDLLWLRGGFLGGRKLRIFGGILLRGEIPGIYRGILSFGMGRCHFGIVRGREIVVGSCFRITICCLTACED